MDSNLDLDTNISSRRTWNENSKLSQTLMIQNGMEVVMMLSIKHSKWHRNLIESCSVLHKTKSQMICGNGLVILYKIGYLIIKDPLHT